MRILLMILALGLGAALAAPAEAGLRISLGTNGGAGKISVHRGDSFKGERRSHQRPERRMHRRSGRRAGRRSGRRRNYGYFSYPYNFYSGYGYVLPEPERASVAPPPAPVPPVAVVPADPPPPPDPHGPLRLTVARGVAPGTVPYVLGEALPGNVPHVTLNWREFELPEPPSGRLYARVGRDVLLITAAGRVVERVLPPG